VRPAARVAAPPPGRVAYGWFRAGSALEQCLSRSARTDRVIAVNGPSVSSIEERL
jgi:hypothetical protein